MADSSFFTDGGSGSGTFQTIEAKIAEAEAAKVAAEAAQAAAEQAETDAQTAEAGSVAAKNTAVASSSNAAISESNSASSSANASNKASDAQKLAINPEDSQYTLSDGSTTGYSALHYGEKAADSLASATTQASNAAASAVTAGQHKDDAQSAKTAAESARDSALSALDNFEDNYLGDHSSDPTTDGDGDPLTAGSIYFNSTDNVVKVYTGSAWVVAYADGATLVAKAGDTMTGDLSFGDNDKAIFGSSSDLQLYHDGSHSYIHEVGAGDLRLLVNDFELQSTYYNQTMMRAVSNSGVSLYYSNFPKLETSSTGIGVYGDVECGGVDVTGSITLTGTVDGRDVATDGTKLDTIDTNADVTPSWVPASDPSYLTSADGGNAATLDGIDSSSFLRSDANDTTTGDLTISKADAKLRLYDSTGTSGNNPFIEFDTTANQGIAIELNVYDGELPEGGYGLVVKESTTNTQWPSTGDLTFSVLGEIYAGSESLSSVNKVWHAGNDGSGSGLDADTLDGIQASSFLRSDTADTFTGTLTMGLQQALVANNYGRGVFGLYSATRYQHVWSMGTAYKTSDDGTSYGNMYGLTFTHTNIGTGTNQAISGLGHQLQLRMNGTLHAAIGSGIWTSGNVTAYSDIAVKTNLEVIPNALDKVCQLNGYTYDRTDYEVDPVTGEMPETRQAGVVAQQVEKVLPEVVSGEDGNKAVAYGNMVSILIEAIKELKQEIEELKKG
jgi:hypothetical protein